MMSTNCRQITGPGDDDKIPNEDGREDHRNLKSSQFFTVVTFGEHSLARAILHYLGMDLKEMWVNICGALGGQRLN